MGNRTSVSLTSCIVIPTAPGVNAFVVVDALMQWFSVGFTSCKYPLSSALLSIVKEYRAQLSQRLALYF